MTSRRPRGGFVPAGQHEMMSLLVFVVVFTLATFPALVPDRNDHLGCVKALARAGATGDAKDLACPEKEAPYRLEATETGATIYCPKPEGHLLHGLRVVREDGAWRFVQDLPEPPAERDETFSSRLRTTRITVTEEKASASTRRKGWFRYAFGLLGLLVSCVGLVGCVVTSVAKFAKADADGVLALLFAACLALCLAGSAEWFAGGRLLTVEADTGAVTVHKTWFGTPSAEGEAVGKPLAVIAAPMSKETAELVLVSEEEGAVRFRVLGVVSAAAGEALAALNRGLGAGGGPGEDLGEPAGGAPERPVPANKKPTGER